MLRRQPHLCYFQGYHDICQVLLLVLPTSLPVRAGEKNDEAGPGSCMGLRASSAARLSALRIRDFMLPSLGPAVAQLRLIPEILARADRELWERLARGLASRGGGPGFGSGSAGAGPDPVPEPYFALPDTLTMFAHNVRRLPDIARLFDALLARDPGFALYLFAALVSSRRGRLLADDVADEPDILHVALSKLPQSFDEKRHNQKKKKKQPKGRVDEEKQEDDRDADETDEDDEDAEDDLDAVIASAARLAAAHPPETLPSWRPQRSWRQCLVLLLGSVGVSGSAAVSRDSALRTARDVRACARAQTLADGRAHFEAQLRELRRADRVRALRARIVRLDTRPNRLAALAVLVGVAAAAVYARWPADGGGGGPFGFGSLWGYAWF